MIIVVEKLALNHAFKCTTLLIQIKCDKMFLVNRIWNNYL